MHSDITVEKECTPEREVNYGQIGYITAGQARLKYKGNTVDLPQFSMYYIPSHTPVKVECEAPFTHYWTKFTIFSADTQKMFNTINYSIPHIIHEHSIVTSAFSTMQNLSLKKDFKSKTLFFSAFLHSLSYLLSDDKSHTPSSDHPLVKKCCDLIESELTQISSVHDLAKRIHCHPTYLSNVFSKNYSSTLLKYINKRKIEQAKSFISDSRKSLAEISQDSGFSNYYHFSKCFKKYTGHSPRAFQKKLISQSL
ncbi:MAG: helix-turn-helix transcriptional regulator [Planctomycetes bacterium]|nr:helix-turn-helix transcriptional regulator [Planctomycetota bacterium]